MRGAALSGLKNIQPTSRRSRLHYGWSCTEAFDGMRHDVRDRFLSEWDGSPQASGNMRWPLSKVSAALHSVYTYLDVLLTGLG